MTTANLPKKRYLVIGCTPLARKVIDCIEDGYTVAGVVNLDPVVGANKSNYDPLAEFGNPLLRNSIPKICI